MKINVKAENNENMKENEVMAGKINQWHQWRK
jgi:hypothetical protein